MKKEKVRFVASKISRKTRKLFDRSFKFIMARASHPAIVHLINGLYKKNYPPDTVVDVRKPREYITENPESGELGEMFTDMVVILSTGERRDTYLIEVQIRDDMEIVLRVFEYSIQIALESKVVSEDGMHLQVNMPEPIVIYWETSKTKDFLTIEMRFPGNKKVVYQVPAFKVLEHSISELEHQALLLPFYLLKVREELKKCAGNSEKRKELANRLAGYVNEIAEVLRKSQENNYITNVDAAMLKGRMANMHSELYGGYKEFSGVDMTLKQMYNTSVFKKMDDAKAEGIMQVAKAMKAAGEAVDKIMNYTGLSRRKITSL